MDHPNPILKRSVRIVVVSPRDVQDERDMVREIAESMNKGVLLPDLGLVLEVYQWETDSYPIFHAEGPQGHIDEILKIDNSDIVIGIFWARFGTMRADGRTNTEHELHNAQEAWKKSQRPHIMLYFSSQQGDFTDLDTDQLKAVQQFKKNPPAECLQWNYDGKEKFAPLLKDHLEKFIHDKYKLNKKAPTVEVDLSRYGPPHFTNGVFRKSSLSALRKEIENHSVVAVEGLSGSGKTDLVASYFTNENNEEAGQALWYTPTQKGETIDSFFTNISPWMQFQTESAAAKCKELLSFLGEKHIPLVIDDVQNVDPETFSILVNAAANFSGPARLILISPTYVDLMKNFRQIGHVRVEGFELDEMKLFLKARGVANLGTESVKTLLEQTDGLPQAASWFVTLVHDFGRNPIELLDGAMHHDRQLKKWFADIYSSIGKMEAKLLTILSVCEGPFDLPLVRSLGQDRGVDNVEDVFEELQRKYLVQRYREKRLWKIHYLIALFCGPDRGAPERKLVHQALANYYYKIYHGRSRRHAILLTYNEFNLKLRACHEYQLGGDSKSAQRIIHEIAKTAKVRGYYNILMKHCAHEIDIHAERSDWIDYHYAHCCLITGNLQKGAESVDRLIYSKNEQDVKDRIAFTRLYAEIIGSMGNPDLALTKLRESLSGVDLANVHPNILSHARSVEVWLLTLLEEYGEAELLCRENLKENEREDSTGRAVALTRYGVICLLSGHPEAAFKKLTAAENIFRKTGDKRGLAWVTSYLALTSLELDNEQGALTKLEESVRIDFDIEGCSVDYLSVLQTMSKKATDPDMKRLISRELKRVGSILDILVTRAPSDV